jgi:hypothetical protein
MTTTPLGAARYARAIAVIAVAAAALAGCLAPAGGPRDWNHAAWCGASPPSGYCIVPETGR